jgi:putative aldouronate transport system permease protein
LGAAATVTGISERQPGGTPTPTAAFERVPVSTDTRRRDTRALWREVKKNRALLYLITPGILYFVIFHYLPIYGISFAFVDYSPKYGQGVVANYLTSPWIGFQHFVDFFTGPKFFPLLRNTVVLGFYSVLFEFPASILFAVCLYEVHNLFYRKFAQTISFLPHFISTVSVVAMMVMLFSPSDGYVNWLLGSIGIEPIYFMAEPGWFRPLYVGSGIWAGIGWGAIVYLAAMYGIPTSLYESAAIDGASRLQKIVRITLPSILPTIMILLILRVGAFINVGVEKILLMYNPLTYEVADVIGTYVYRRGIVKFDYSFATAVGMFNSVVNLLLLVVANYTARKVADESLW